MQLFMLLLIAMLYMFRAPLAHRQELRNCVCSLWYCHVALCNNMWYSFSIEKLHHVLLHVIT